jgi:hypothetical protein
MACDPAVNLNVDVIALRHATLKLLKLYLKRCGAAAKRKHGLGHAITAARVRDVQLDDVFPPPCPSAATIAANRKNPATVCHLAFNRRQPWRGARAMCVEIFYAFHELTLSLATFKRPLLDIYWINSTSQRQTQYITTLY